MSLMKTFTKVALGYAAARGVDRMSSGKGLGGLFGGGAQIKGQHPTTRAGGQMTEAMTGGMGGGMASNPAAPMQAMLEKMRRAGFDLGGLMGQDGGTSSGGGRGLLSAMPAQGGGLAGMATAAGGAAMASGKGVGALIDQFNMEGQVPGMEENAGLMLRAMIQAAKCDGEIDAEERDKILDLVGDDATDEDMAFVRAQLEAPVDPEALAADTPAAQKMPVYSAALMSIRVDTDAEAEFLDRLARALELDEPSVNALHLQMGNAPLYT